MNEGAGLASVDREYILPLRIGDAIAANAVHRLAGLSLVDNRLLNQGAALNIEQSYLVVIGIAHLLNEVEALSRVTDGIKAEVAVNVDGLESGQQRAGPHEEGG